LHRQAAEQFFSSIPRRSYQFTTSARTRAPTALAALFLNPPFHRDAGKHPLDTDGHLETIARAGGGSAASNRTTLATPDASDDRHLDREPFGKQHAMHSARPSGVDRMVMVLPFAMVLVAAVLACLGRAKSALWLGLATVVVQVGWLIYHATDALKISL
jgi:hypothetical protein